MDIAGIHSEMAKRESLNIRIKADDKGLIDRAAAIRGRNRTDFILEAARQAAEEALLDQSLIVVKPEAYEAFVEALDREATPNDRLRQSMSVAALWKQ